MIKAKYVLDANVFINMQRFYPQDIFGSLWSKITNIVDEGAAISCREVFEELSVGDDFLVKWAEQRKSIFVESGTEVQSLVRKILSKYPLLVTGSSKSNSADPFVIALAMQKSCTLVSDETRAGSGNPEKIPNVCEAYNVQLIKFNDFLREVEVNI